MNKEWINLIMEEYIINWFRFKIHYWEKDTISISPWNNSYTKLDFTKSDPKIISKFIDALNDFYHLLAKKDIL